MSTNFLVLFFLLSTFTFAEDRSDLEAKLRPALEKQIVTMKRFCKGDHLHFSAAGDLKDKCDEGIWTLDGTLSVKKVQVLENAVQIEGNRVAIGFENGQPRNFDLPQPITIDIESGVPISEPATRSAVSRIFLTSSDSLGDFLPESWSHVYKRTTPQALPPSQPSRDSSKPAQRVRISSGVAMRSCISKVRPIHPAYPSIAKNLHRQGTVILHALINREGIIENVGIIQPLGFGLDEAAIDAVKQWKYRPYILNGDPVEVDTQIEVHFNLQG